MASLFEVILSNAGRRVGTVSMSLADEIAPAGISFQGARFAPQAQDKGFHRTECCSWFQLVIQCAGLFRSNEEVTLKRTAIALLAVLLLAACATPTPQIIRETVMVTQPPLPTYTSYPTFTPLPTYNPWPTPTSQPTQAVVTPTPLPTPTPLLPSPTPTPEPPTQTPQPTSTPTPAITDWRGEYYGNRDLSAEPALVRNDVAINFNWGLGVPAAKLPADDFSARWTRDLDFEAATYRFHAIVDDGVRLWVDEALIINDWYDNTPHEVTADYATVRGAHRVQVEYYEGSGEAQIQVWWEKIASPSYPDWRAEYWPNRDLDGTPALMRNEQDINFYWGIYSPATGLPVDNFAARWSRNVGFEPGLYRFYAWSDDGVRFYVDGNLFMNQWNDSSGDTLYTVDLNLTGTHRLEIEYYEHIGQALIRFWWRKIA